MQLGEIELLGIPLALTLTTDTGGVLRLTFSMLGTLLSTINLSSPVFWVAEGPISGTVTITPTSDAPAKYYRLRVP